MKKNIIILSAIAVVLGTQSIFAYEIDYGDNFVRAATGRSGGSGENVEEEDLQAFSDRWDGVYVYTGNAWNKNVDVKEKLLDTYYNNKGLDEPENWVIEKKEFPKKVENKNNIATVENKKEEPEIKTIEPEKTAKKEEIKQENKKAPSFDNLKKETKQEVKNTENKAPNLKKVQEKITKENIVEKKVEEVNNKVEEKVEEVNNKVDEINKNINDKVEDATNKINDIKKTANEQVDKVKTNITDTIFGLTIKHIHLINILGFLVLVVLYASITSKKNKAKK